MMMSLLMGASGHMLGTHIWDELCGCIPSLGMLCDATMCCESCVLDLGTHMVPG